MALRPYTRRALGVPRSDPEYVRRYRASNPEAVEGNRKANAARSAAARRVAALHPDEFERFLAEELAARGLT